MARRSGSLGRRRDFLPLGANFADRWNGQRNGREDLRARGDFLPRRFTQRYTTGIRPPGPPERSAMHALQGLWTSAAEYLLGRSEVPPQPPADWHLDATLSRTCADCGELQAFARDPWEIIRRFRVNKARRRHLHQVIGRYKLDMTHETERSGSPQTLVCTKDRRTFNARMKEYRDEIAAMRTLVELTHKATAAVALSKRMETAVQASSN